ncbi:MAG: TatD family hydrolase [Bacteroidota bacterium]
MVFHDTHAHIYLKDFKEDVADIINRSHEKQVLKVVMPNINSETVEQMLEIEERFKGICYSSIGLHPCDVKKDFEKELYKMEDWLKSHSFVAIGETGTDLYWDKSFIEQQKESLRIQCNFAKEYNIPIILHSRDSFEETFSIMESEKNEKLNGVFHCFTGSIEEAEKVRKIGFYIGLGGVSTFKNAGMDKVIPEIDMDNVVLETDSPYLAPVPHRGKRNEPSYIPLIAERIADLRKMDLEEVAEITTKNSSSLFNLS